MTCLVWMGFVDKLLQGSHLIAAVNVAKLSRLLVQESHAMAPSMNVRLQNGWVSPCITDTMSILFTVHGSTPDGDALLYSPGVMTGYVRQIIPPSILSEWRDQYLCFKRFHCYISSTVTMAPGTIGSLTCIEFALNNFS